MATFDVTLRDGAGAGSLPVTNIVFADIVPTVPTAEASVFVWNDFGTAGVPVGVDDFPEGRVTITGRVAGSPGGTQFEADGLVALDSMAVHVRILSSNIPNQTTTGAALGIGAGASFALPVLESSQYVELGISITLPATPSGDVTLSIQVSALPSSPVPAGVENQILNGLGDETFTYLAERGSTLASTVPDDTVTIEDLQAVKKGVPWFEAEHTETFDDVDGSAATLLAGESYLVAFTLGDSSLTLTKGDKTTQPLTENDLPTLPTGEELFMWLEVPFGLVIEQSKIHDDVLLDDLVEVSLFNAVVGGTALLIGPGRGISNSHEINWQTVRQTDFIGVEDDVSIVSIDSAGNGLTQTLVFDATLGQVTNNVPPGNPLQLYRVTFPVALPGNNLIVERIAETGL